MGWENVFHCEYNPFGQRVLKHYWPNAISYGDIKQTDFTIHRGQIDILSGGFPCQPFSIAGKRKGTEDDRHLWPEMLRAIREIQPGYVVGENVRGLTNWNGGMVFDQVQADLEAEGYEVIPFLLPACAVNAPHRRDRIWFIAHAKEGVKPETEANLRERPNPESFTHNGTEVWDRINPVGCLWPTPDTGIESQRMHTDRREQAERYVSSRSSRIIERGTWDNFPTQPPVRSRNDGLPDRLDGLTVSKHRKESIMAYGNAIVPQIAHEIFKAIDYAIH